MAHPLARAAAVMAAGLASLGVLAGCGNADTGTSQAPAETTAGTAATADPSLTATTQAGATPSTTSASSTDSATAAAETTTATPGPQETRAEILLLEGPQLDGQQFDLAATAGNDVLLWFWAPW